MSIFLVTIWLLRAPSSEVVRVSRSILLVWHGEPVLDINNYSLISVSVLSFMVVVLIHVSY